jgi:iron complex outermembrane recepter protein
MREGTTEGSRMGRPAAGLAALATAAATCAAGAVPSTSALADLSLEQLANIEVTSVSKRGEPLADAAASVFVITSEDIRRYGARSLPEALRLAPNLQVAQSSANAYAVRARGVYNNSANKLLVLIDGRSVYSPLFAGVFWDVQEVVLEDVERIEVISGPGGTLWGVNAVNGVINVITKPARATQGTLVAGAGGNLGSDGAVRYGGRLAQGHYRIYAKHVDRENTENALGEAIDDASHLAQGGFRADWETPSGRLMLQAGAYRGAIGQPRPGSISISGVDLPLAAIAVSGVNVTTHWSHRLAAGSEVSVQAYFDRTRRNVPPTFGQDLDLFDIQAQHSLGWRGGHTLVWGAQHRHGVDHITNSEYFAFLPADVKQAWSSLFANGEMKLQPGLSLIAGARLERNDYTGTEFLPNVRLAWQVAPQHLLWTAASRTVRAPSRLDRDPFVPGRPPFLLRGGPDVPAEVAEVYEVGFRGQWAGRASYSATAYHADYDRLHTQEIAPSRTFLTFAGMMEGATDGIELWGAWQATSAWRLSAGYTAQRVRLRLKPGSNDAAAPGAAGRDPEHSWIVRSSLNISPGLELDAVARGVAQLENPTVPRYWTADLRLAWRPMPRLELSLAGRNLGDGGHGEFGAAATRTESGPSFHAAIRWEFGAR